MDRPDNTLPDNALGTTTSESGYRSLSSLAMGSLLVSLLSVSVIFDAMFSAVPITAIVLGWLALRAIRDQQGGLGGAWAAWAGIILAIGIWGGCTGYMAWARAMEVPSGYTAITYEALTPDPDAVGELIPKKAYDYDGKTVFVQGYMYPGRQMFKLKKFVISRDNGVCKFCVPNPRPTDQIEVTLVGDLVAHYTNRLIAVGGKLHVQPKDKAATWGGVAYRLEADYLRE